MKITDTYKLKEKKCGRNIKWLVFTLFMATVATTGWGQAFAPKKEIYHKGWNDLNKNGKKDIYEDPTKPVDARVQDLLSKMNLNEKSCQLATLYGYQRVLKDSLPTKD
ncbi:hypothetical protein GCM10027566_11120 [Arachidicoccus ginsenosidivorans]|uniref:hypothetical protein n=1 Tax=Arachidicoccus ginsenosidivorans TaxID=496057 RepID=UPI001CEFA0C2|nr:hypothetical protein [Arachidicoccus ginsenosidivorans]